MTPVAELANPHDKFFKEALTQPEAARVFLRDFLPPAVAEELDLAHLDLLKDSFIDDSLQEHFADLVFEVTLREQSPLRKETLFVCVIFEHKSYVDPLTALQLLRYMTQAWDYSLRQRGRLLPVLPVVIYHGVNRWSVAANFQALFSLPDALRPYVPEFRYLLTDLSVYSDEELKRTAQLGVGLLTLKYIFRPSLRARLPEVLALWYTIQEQERALGYLEAIIRYVTSASQYVSAEDVRAAIETAASEGDPLMGTIAQEWLQQGLQQGLREGEERGLRQGLLSGIRLALKLKFGLAGAALMPEISRIEDIPLLQTVGDGIELADTPEDLRRLYQQPNG